MIFYFLVLLTQTSTIVHLLILLTSNLLYFRSSARTGNCLDDSDCEGELVCYQTEGSGEIIPGCSGETIDDKTNFCFVPTVHSGNPPLTFIGDELSSYGECEGGEFCYRVF